MEEGDLNSLSPSTNTEEGLSEEEEKILLEKEFDDYYEDRVHKSAGPVVFLSKSMAMLPVIWTDDEAESECKTYFNLGCLFSNCIVAILFGIFKCTSFAEVLYKASEVDSQLELKEKHYDKIKRKTLYWVSVELILIAAHVVGVVFMFEDIQRDLILMAVILAANLAIGVLDLQYIHLCMVLCKRYRMLNKIMAHITQPFKTFRAEEPSHQMLQVHQKILSYRWESIKKEEASKTFDQIWEPSEKDEVQLPDNEIADPVKVDMSKMDIPPALLTKSNDHEIF